MKFYKLLIYFSILTMGIQVLARELSDSLDIDTTVSSIKDKRLDEMTKRFNNGSNCYMFFSNSEADLLHMLGLLSGYDGSLVSPGFTWDGYEISAVDSIIQWYARNRHSLEEDSLRKWLNWQQDYFDYMRSPEYTYGVLAAMFQNWNDSIKDERLRKIFLNTDGTWKMVFIDKDWRDLPADLKTALKELKEQLPNSIFIKNKQKLDSLESRYYGLGAIFKE